MPPWVERPTITIDLSRVRRGVPADLPPEAIAASKALLGEVMATIPAKARVLAYLLAIRTAQPIRTRVQGRGEAHQRRPA